MQVETRELESLGSAINCEISALDVPITVLQLCSFVASTLHSVPLPLLTLIFAYFFSIEV